MSETTVPPPSSGRDRATRYGDTLALSDIHVVLTSPNMKAVDDEKRQAITDILVRTGRSPYLSRVITATVEDGPHGVPVACVDAEGTIVIVGPEPSGPGIRIDVAPRDPADETALVVAVGNTVIRRAHSTAPRYGGPS